MKKIFILGSILCILASCSTYQINVLNSNTTHKNEKSGDFIVENDTLAITYRFNGKDAPLNIRIKNKLNEPLYINWEKSALIFGDQVVNYAGNKIDIEGTYNGDINSYFRRYQSQTGTLNGTATLPERTSFIPPLSSIERTLLNVTNNGISLSKGSFKNIKTYSVDGLTSFNAKTASFNKDNSPFTFRSYLTLYIEKGKDLQVLPYQQEFYVSQLIQMNVNPKKTEFYPENRADIFYTSKVTGYGKTIAVAGAVAVIGAAAVDKTTSTRKR